MKHLMSANHTSHVSKTLRMSEIAHRVITSNNGPAFRFLSQLSALLKCPRASTFNRHKSNVPYVLFLLSKSRTLRISEDTVSHTLSAIRGRIWRQSSKTSNEQEPTSSPSIKTQPEICQLVL